MASDQEKNRQHLKQLLRKSGNGNCADCGAADPEWASYTLGVFVCHSCSGLHRNIAQISKVKSVLLDPWSSTEVEFMDSVGNNAAKAKYEQIVPAFYYCPTYKDCMILREQWIRAKYERKEFLCVERQEPYSAGAFWEQNSGTPQEVVLKSSIRNVRREDGHEHGGVIGDWLNVRAFTPQAFALQPPCVNTQLTACVTEEQCLPPLNRD